jgi:antitoxin PrlF
MHHSTVTTKGQTTIPGEIRQTLKIKPGDRLEYAIEGDHAIVRVHPGTRSLKGILASTKGRNLSFAQIRQAAAKAARDRGTRS